MAREIIEPEWLILVRLYTPTLLAIGSVIVAWVGALLAFWLKVRDHGRRLRDLEAARKADMSRLQTEREHDQAAVERKLDKIEGLLNDVMKLLIK